jgi:hypothetical protein
MSDRVNRELRSGVETFTLEIRDSSSHEPAYFRTGGTNRNLKASRLEDALQFLHHTAMSWQDFAIARGVKASRI